MALYLGSEKKSKANVIMLDGYSKGYNDAMNALDILKSDTSGSIVSINDALPIEHELSVKLRSKNLIPYPYVETTKTKNGVTFTDNGDGTITLNGTATANTSFFLNYAIYLPVDGSYTLSGCPAGGSFSTYLFALNYYVNNTETIGVRDLGDGVVKTISLQKNTRANAYIYIYSGTTFSNLTFKPQLELGTTATTYTPYVKDFTEVKVYRYGKNLFDINNYTIMGKPTYQIGENSLKATCTWDDCIAYTISNLTPFTKYCFSYRANNADFSFVYYEDAKGLNIFYTKKFVLEAKANGTIIIYFRNSATAPREFDVYDIQLEAFETQTAYEQYIEPQTVTANADGTVKGLTNLSPNMTLVTDTDGAIINLKYFKDANLALENQALEIAMSGGE